MFAYPLETWFFGPFDLFVEHGHRLLGSLAGMVAIVLVVVTMRNEARKSVRWFSVALLILVICQGLLGGLRVLFDARTLAKVHGCVGPAFFAAVIGFCVVTSKWWVRQLELDAHRPKLRAVWVVRLATLLLVMSFCQLVIGAFLRHIAVDARPSVYTGLVAMHVRTALLLFIGTFTQWIVAQFKRFKGTGIRSSINFLMLLVVVQIMLGVGTWVVKFGWPVWFSELGFAATFVVGEKTFIQMNLITAHVAVGSLILAAWTFHMLRCRRVIYCPNNDLVKEDIRRQRTESTPGNDTKFTADEKQSEIQPLTSS